MLKYSRENGPQHDEDDRHPWSARGPPHFKVRQLNPRTRNSMSTRKVEASDRGDIGNLALQDPIGDTITFTAIPVALRCKSLQSPAGFRM